MNKRPAPSNCYLSPEGREALRAEGERLKARLALLRAMRPVPQHADAADEQLKAFLEFRRLGRGDTAAGELAEIHLTLPRGVTP
jgi:hypothetical protein